MKNKLENNIINQNENSYLFNMNNENNKINKYKADVTVEYGEQDLKEILLQAIKSEYINHYKDNNNTSS